MNEELELLRDKKGFICDMDGVIYHGNRLLPGVTEFVDWLQRPLSDQLLRAFAARAAAEAGTHGSGDR